VAAGVFETQTNGGRRLQSGLCHHRPHFSAVIGLCQSAPASPADQQHALPAFDPRTKLPAPVTSLLAQSRGPSSALRPAASSPVARRGTFQAQHLQPLHSQPNCSGQAAGARAVPQKGPSQPRSQQTHQEQAPRGRSTRALLMVAAIRATSIGKAIALLGDLSAPAPSLVVGLHPTCSGATPRRAAMAARIASMWGLLNFGAPPHHHRVHIDHLPAALAHQAASPARAAAGCRPPSSARSGGKKEAMSAEG